jgi:hypothetical protein
MNFAENFTSKIKASAEKAASAAKNFKGFDEMADQDEYIHSEGLNVKSCRRERQQQQKEEDQGVSQEEQKSPSLPASASWSLLDRPPRGSNHGMQTPPPYNANRQQRLPPMPAARAGHAGSSSVASASSAASSRSTSPIRQSLSQSELYYGNDRPSLTKQTSMGTQRSQTSMPLLSVVADALEGSSISESGRHRRTSLNSGYASDDDDSSVNRRQNQNDSHSSSSSSSDSEDDSDDDEEDPILSQIRHKKKRSTATTMRQYNKRSNRNKHKDRKNSKSKKEKNPHRFMQDLEQRGAGGMEESYLSPTDFAQKRHVLEMEQSPQNGSNSNTTSLTTTNNPISSLKSWIASPFSKNSTNSVTSKAVSFLKRGPLSRARDNSNSNQKQTVPTTSEQEEFQVLVSSSVLGDEELAALAQYKEQQGLCCKAWSCFKSACGKIRKHPRESFILFTLVLGIVVFFYSRRKSNEDDVT